MVLTFGVVGVYGTDGVRVGDAGRAGVDRINVGVSSRDGDVESGVDGLKIDWNKRPDYL